MLVNNKKVNKMNKKDKEYIGWECPRCGSVNAPQKEKCKCVKIESEEKDSKQLLIE